MKGKKPIVLCGGENGRCVVFGWVDADPVPGEPVVQYNARMILSWPANCRGLFGLVRNGPIDGVSMTPPVERTTQVTWRQDLAVSEDAARKFDDFPSE